MPEDVSSKACRQQLRIDFPVVPLEPATPRPPRAWRRSRHPSVALQTIGIIQRDNAFWTFWMVRRGEEMCRVINAAGIVIRRMHQRQGRRSAPTRAQENRADANRQPVLANHRRAPAGMDLRFAIRFRPTRPIGIDSVPHMRENERRANRHHCANVRQVGAAIRTAAPPRLWPINKDAVLPGLAIARAAAQRESPTLPSQRPGRQNRIAARRDVRVHA